MKENKKQKQKQAAEWVSKWRKTLFLAEWRIRLDFPEKQSQEGPGEGWEVAAETKAIPEYMTAYISVFPSWFEKDEWEREETIVHELCHCITQEAWDCSRNMLAGKLKTEQDIWSMIEKLTQKITLVAFDNQKPLKKDSKC